MVLKKLKNRFDMPLGRIVCFFIVLCLLVSCASYYLQYRERYNDNSSFQIIDFYKEEKNSADAVFIGSSCCFSFYSPLFVYENYGIRTMNYSSSGMGMEAYKYAIEEVRKYQKDARIILTITPNYWMQYLGVHFMADYMPFSLNKVRFLTAYFTQPEESILNSIGFFFPIMEYHDRWAEMSLDDFKIDEGIKGATRHQYYLHYVNDISDAYYVSDERIEMPERMDYFISDLLDYCDENKENIVFLLPPRIYSEEENAQMNTLMDTIKERGYEFLDLRDRFDELKLDKTQDFYDVSHTNIHGSIKYSDYLAKYLMENKECEIVKDEGFDKAVENYREIISECVIDVETDMKHRDYDLARPKLLSVRQDGASVTLNWEEVKDADGYIVYRRQEGGFKRICEINTSLSYTDDTAEKGKVYTYTVLSYREDNGTGYYGNYDYKGLEIEVK